jgi:hypothetical protein
MMTRQDPAHKVTHLSDERYDLLEVLVQDTKTPSSPAEYTHQQPEVVGLLVQNLLKDVTYRSNHHHFDLGSL